MATVVITGCSSGFGLAATVGFAERGDTVVATMRDLGRRQGLDTALAEVGHRVHVLPLDVTDPASREALVADVIERFGRIDVLVNNAGIAHLGPIEEIHDHEFRALYETNLFGPVELMKLVLPGMRGHGSGRIVNVTSVGAIVAPAYLGAFASTKHALDAISRSLDLELTPTGIRVVTVAPGGYRTDIYARNSTFYDTATTKHTHAARLTAASQAAATSNNDLSPVVEAIIQAATENDPRIRYLVGDGMPPGEQKSRPRTQPVVSTALRRCVVG